jgi:hypothetical protein
MRTLNLFEFHKDKKLIILRSNREFLYELVQNNLTIPRLAELAESVCIFLTTESEKVQNDSIAEYGDKLVINKGKVGHIDSILLHTGKDECGDISRTILDFHCIQNCDMAIVSG